MSRTSLAVYGVANLDCATRLRGLASVESYGTVSLTRALTAVSIRVHGSSVIYFVYEIDSLSHYFHDSFNVASLKCLEVANVYFI